MAITQLTKIVSGSLVPSNEKLSSTLLEVSATAGNGLTVSADGLLVDLSAYATTLSVEAKIAEAQLAGGEVDLTAYATKDDVTTAISTKVDKVAGKGLSTEDFTTAHKTSLEGLDTNISNKINTAIATVVDGAPDAFNTLKEIADWIEGDGVTATELSASIAGKVDKPTVAEPADLNTPTVNSLPLYTLNNNGDYVLCKPDKWLVLDGFYIPGYTEATLKG